MSGLACREQLAAAAEQLALLRNPKPVHALPASPQRRTLSPLVKGDDDLSDFLQLVPIYIDDLLPRGANEPMRLRCARLRGIAMPINQKVPGHGGWQSKCRVAAVLQMQPRLQSSLPRFGCLIARKLLSSLSIDTTSAIQCNRS